MVGALTRAMLKRWWAMGLGSGRDLLPVPSTPQPPKGFSPNHTPERAPTTPSPSPRTEASCESGAATSTSQGPSLPVSTPSCATPSPPSFLLRSLPSAESFPGRTSPWRPSTPARPRQDHAHPRKKDFIGKASWSDSVTRAGIVITTPGIILPGTFRQTPQPNHACFRARMNASFALSWNRSSRALHQRRWRRYCGPPAKVYRHGEEGMRYWLTAMRKCVVFRGRASRKEYWMFILTHALIVLGLIFLATWTGLDMLTGLVGLYILATYLPLASAAARRLHDIDRSGWWQVVPVVGIIMLCLPGDKDYNRFGSP